jgi:hypothetical protein
MESERPERFGCLSVLVGQRSRNHAVGVQVALLVSPSTPTRIWDRFAQHDFAGLFSYLGSSVADGFADFDG